MPGVVIRALPSAAFQTRNVLSSEPEMTLVPSFVTRDRLDRARVAGERSDDVARVHVEDLDRLVGRGRE